MSDPIAFDAVLELLRSGRLFQPGHPVGTTPDDEREARLRDAFGEGQARHWQRLLYPNFAPEFVVVEADSGDTFDREGRPRLSGELTGDVRVLPNRCRFTDRDTGVAASPFSAGTLLLPGANAIELRPGAVVGTIELTLKLSRALVAHAWTDEQLRHDARIYCDAADAAVLDAFRALGLGEWTCQGKPVWPRFGVGSPVDPLAVVRSPVARLVAGTPAAAADRFLGIPARGLADCADREVRFRIRVGGDADDILTRLATRLRLNCLPLWNAVVASDEWSGLRPLEVEPENWFPVIDPLAVQSTVENLLVLECLDPATGRTWHDRRFAGDRDATETFEPKASEAEAKAERKLELRFPVPPDTVALRLSYLAGQGRLGELRPDVSRFFGGTEQLLVKSAVAPAPGAPSVTAGEFACGRAVTGAELIELVWRLAPLPIRTRIDTAAVARLGASAVGLWVELDATAAARSLPRTVVTLPRGPEQTADVSYWLASLSREAERYTAGGVEVRLEPIRRTNGGSHG